jgi:hypothetical protein
LRWTVQGEKPVAELEIYRPGGKFNQTKATSVASVDGVSGVENLWAARHALIGAPAKMLVFMQLFSRPIIIVMQCGRIDLVTAAPRRLN